MSTKKTCKVCRKEMDVSKFGKGNCKDGYKKECKECYLKKFPVLTERECTCCKKTKPIEMFSLSCNRNGYRANCKECRVEGERKRQIEKKKDEPIKPKTREFDTSKPYCAKTFMKPEKVLTDAQILEKQRKKERYYAEREQELERRREYYANNKEKSREWQQGYKERRNMLKRYRRQTDKLYAIIESLRARIHGVLKSSKRDTTSELIGCTSEQIHTWIGSQFEEGWTWENHGEVWHIDHVVPISLIYEKHPKACFNWTNLRPLCAQENMEKGNKLCMDDILKHAKYLENFVDKNPGYQIIPESEWWLGLVPRYGENSVDSNEITIDDLMQTGNQQPSEQS